MMPSIQRPGAQIGAVTVSSLGCRYSKLEGPRLEVELRAGERRRKNKETKFMKSRFLPALATIMLFSIAIPAALAQQPVVVTNDFTQSVPVTNIDSRVPFHTSGKVQGNAEVQIPLGMRLV